MPNHECEKEKEWGAQEQVNKSFFQHIQDGIGYRTCIVTIVFAIVAQVVTFACLWGQLTTRVNYHDEFLKKIDAIIFPIAEAKNDKKV